MRTACDKCPPYDQWTPYDRAHRNIDWQLCPDHERAVFGRVHAPGETFCLLHGWGRCTPEQLELFG